MLVRTFIGVTANYKSQFPPFTFALNIWLHAMIVILDILKEKSFLLALLCIVVCVFYFLSLRPRGQITNVNWLPLLLAPASLGLESNFQSINKSFSQSLFSNCILCKIKTIVQSCVEFWTQCHYTFFWYPVFVLELGLEYLFHVHVRLKQQFVFILETLVLSHLKQNNIYNVGYGSNKHCFIHSGKYSVFFHLLSSLFYFTIDALYHITYYC